MRIRSTIFCVENQFFLGEIHHRKVEVNKEWFESIYISKESSSDSDISRIRSSTSSLSAS